MSEKLITTEFRGSYEKASKLHEYVAGKVLEGDKIYWYCGFVTNSRDLTIAKAIYERSGYDVKTRIGKVILKRTTPKLPLQDENNIWVIADNVIAITAFSPTTLPREVGPLLAHERKFPSVKI